jgi:uncharacterized protein (DUF1697 family)
MPDTFIALLRGINVGKAKRVAMADLRTLVEGLGYGSVRTLLNSGNVVFTAPKSAAKDAGPKIEKAIATKLGVTSRVTVIDATTLAAAIVSNPLSKVAKEPRLLLVAVFASAADRSLMAPLTKQKWAPEALAVGDRVAYLWVPNGQIESPLAIATWKALGDRVTARNMATMLKLKALTGKI